MNNRRFALLAFLLLFPVLSFSQQQFLDAPFGGGGGFIAGWQFANMKPLSSLSDKSGVFTTGGGGFIYIGFIPNLRVGGMGFSGSTSNNTTIYTPEEPFVTRTEYSIGGGGVTFEYTFPFVRNIGISAGLIIGGGSIDIDLYSNIDRSGNINWQQVLDPQLNNKNFYGHLKRAYWIFTPTLNIDIPVTRFVALRAGAGYQISAGGKWRYNNDIEVTGVPSELNGNSFFIQAGLIAGFFSF